MYKLFKPLLLKLFSVDPELAAYPENMGHEKVLTFRAAPEFLKYRMVGLAILGGIILSGIGLVLLITIVDGEIEGTIAMSIAAVFALMFLFLLYFVARIDYDMRIYVVTDRSLRIREGAWLVREMTLTFANIQNVKVSQGPLERAFGIQNLEVETAGGGGNQQPGQQKNPYSFHTGYLRGIKNAEEIREMIRKRMEKPAVNPKQTPIKPAGEELDLYKQILAQVKRLHQRLGS